VGGGVAGSGRVSVWDRFSEAVSLGSYIPVLRGEPRRGEHLLCARPQLVRGGISPRPQPRGTR
jgi:hypothetical protein